MVDSDRHGNLVSPDLDLIKQAEQGAGWFRDEKGDRTPQPDSEIARIIKEKAAEMGSSAPSRTRRSCTGCSSPR
jgi:hypothetical protein